MSKVFIISAGPGSGELMTIQAKKIIDSLEYAVASSRLAHLCRCETVSPSPVVSGTIESLKKRGDKRTGVIVSGDAGFHSLASAVIKELGRDNVEIIPGISVVQYAFAKLISLHKEFKTADTADSDKFLILAGSAPVKNIVSMIDTDHQIYVLENLSLENEKIVRIENPEDIQKLSEGLSCVIGIRR